MKLTAAKLHIDIRGTIQTKRKPYSSILMTQTPVAIQHNFIKEAKHTYRKGAQQRGKKSIKVW